MSHEPRMKPADPIDRLLEEHRTIMAEVAPLRAAVQSLATGGDDALAGALPALRRVAEMMATDLLAHARREDEALFPAIEAILGAEGTPTAVMREEHREIHANASRFRATLKELNEVEHPALVAESAKLRDLVAGSGSARALRETGAEVIRLLDEHFAKEEEVLFPMARQMLSAADLTRVALLMEDLGAF